MKTRSLFFILLLTVSFAGLAQTTDTVLNVWNLRQCIDYALTNNLTIKRSMYNVESSEIDYSQSKWAMLPNLNGSASHSYGWGRSLNTVDYQYTTERQNSLSLGASSSVTLFNGLRVQNTIKQYSRSLDASEQDLVKTKNDVMLNIASFYINVIFNKEQLANAQYQLASSQTQLERVRKQVAAGALAKSEELNLDAQVATNEVNVVTRENALNLSLLQLKQALQIPASTPLDVEMIDIEVQDLILDQSRDQIYNVARQTMPEIKSASLKVESSYFAVKAAKGNMYPRLSLSGSINSGYSSASDGPRFVPDGGPSTIVYPQIGVVQGTNTAVISSSPVVQPSGYEVDSYGYKDQLKDNVYRTLGLTLSIPIFNNFQSRAAWQRSVINREVATITAKETENTLRQNVETAYNDALAASKTYTSSLRQVQAREEAYRMMSQRYAAGSANSFEYQVSENDLYQAKSDLTRAKYDFIFKKKVLDFYQGKPLDY